MTLCSLSVFGVMSPASLSNQYQEVYKRGRGPQTKEEGRIPQEGGTDVLGEPLPVTAFSFALVHRTEGGI